MPRLLAVLTLCLALTVPALAQQDGLLQIEDPVHEFLLRQQTAGRLPGAFLSHQPLSAYEARAYLDTLAGRRSELGETDRRLLDRYRGAAPGPGTALVRRFLPTLYANHRDVLSVEQPDYAFQASPLVYLSHGAALTSANRSTGVWHHARGLRAAGHIGRHVFFETRLEEIRQRPFDPVYRKRSVPRVGEAKLDTIRQVLDYWQAAGVIGVRSRYFEARFGRDRNRWGVGRNSLLLSNYAPPYEHLQLRTTVWRFQYTNVFAALTDLAPVSEEALDRYGDQIFPAKYGAFHRLALALPGRVELGFFESIVFAPDTLSPSRRTGFELAYLNPVIFYRAVEAARGSPDNALVGVDGRWIAVPGLAVYGQLLLDEFSFRDLRARNGSWTNKYGWLAGLQAAPSFLPGLAVRLEYARIRPFTYSHRTGSWAYVSYDDPLGHPAGPNATDLAFSARYRPTSRLSAVLQAVRTRRGRNTATANYGADPLLPYQTYLRKYGNTIGQGIPQTLWLLEAHAGYELLPDLYLEAGLQAASVRDGIAGLSWYAVPSVLVRWGLPYQSARY